MTLLLWCALAGAQEVPSARLTVSLASPEPVASGPDRSKPPAVIPPVPLELPGWEEHAIGDLKVRLVHVPGVRKVDVRLYLHRGTLDLDGKPTEQGYAAGWLQDVGTAAYDADALALQEDLLDADVWSEGTRLTRSALSVEVPRDDLSAGLDLLAEVVLRPTYPGSEVKRHIRETERWYLYDAPSSSSSVAGALLGYAWYPADSPYGARPDLDALRGLKRKGILAWHAAQLAAAPATVLVVGDVTWAQLEPELARRFGGVGKPGTESPEPPYTPPTRTRVVAADMPGQEQAMIHLRLAAPPREHADRVVFSVVDWALGGPFLSRLNRNLREEKGFTYGSGSRYSAMAGRGTWTVSVEVGATNTAAAITEIERELSLMVADGVLATEVDGAVLDWTTGWNTTLLTANSAFGRYDGLVQEGDTIGAARERLTAAAAVTPETSREVAARWLGAEQPRLWVVVGDRSVVGPQLEALGWEVEWTTPAQAVLGDLTP